MSVRGDATMFQVHKIDLCKKKSGKCVVKDIDFDTNVTHFTLWEAYINETVFNQTDAMIDILD